MKIDLDVAGYIFDGEKVLLVHNKKLDLWLPVGGHIEKDETPDDALLREVKEETGLELIGEPKLIAAQDILRDSGRHIVRLTYVGEVEGEVRLDKEGAALNRLALASVSISLTMVSLFSQGR